MAYPFPDWKVLLNSIHGEFSWEHRLCIHDTKQSWASSYVLEVLSFA